MHSLHWGWAKPSDYGCWIADRERCYAHAPYLQIRCYAERDFYAHFETYNIWAAPENNAFFSQFSRPDFSLGRYCLVIVIMKLESGHYLRMISYWDKRNVSLLDELLNK
jgi:hypothetical protein